MEAHAPGPDLQDLGGVREVVLRLVEEHVAQPPAEDHAEHAVQEHVVDARFGDAVGKALARAQLPEHHEGHEGDHVHEAVPAHGERAEAEDDGVELRVGEHGRVSGKAVEASGIIPDDGAGTSAPTQWSSESRSRP